MTKSELVAKIAEKTGVPKADTAKSIDAFVEVVGDALTDGDKITLVGFGTFKVVDRKEREGRNPSTGDKIKIPAMKLPKFVPGKALKDQIQ